MSGGAWNEWKQLLKERETIMTKQYATAKEVAEALGISESGAYKVIRELNNQLKEAGFITIAGKVNRTYFEEKCCYGGMRTAGD